MAKSLRPSLESFAQAAQQPEQAQAPRAETAQVLDFHQPEKATVAERAPRKDKPHTTLYLDRKVQKIIKEIALQYDRKPHDLYLEGIDLMLTHYGRPSLKSLA